MKEKRKKVLFTGGTGFIGRNLLPELKKKYDVNAPTRQELNLKDSEQVKTYLENGKFHLPNGLHSNGVLSSMAGCNCLIDTKTMENQESRSLNAGDKVGAILL